VQLKVATIDDIEGILKLHNKYQIDSISEEDKKDGFVTTAFTKEELRSIILEEEGIFIIKVDDEVLAYIMSASWQFWSKWDMFTYMIEDLKNLKYRNQNIDINNSYQYGPICIDKSLRGKGTLERLFNFSLEYMSKKYPLLITFVNKVNPRSMNAHQNKLGLKVLQEFQYNSNEYVEFIFDTSKRVSIKKAL
jgi:hypothetical protein